MLKPRLAGSDKGARLKEDDFIPRSKTCSHWDQGGRNTKVQLKGSVYGLFELRANGFVRDVRTRCHDHLS